MSSVCYVYCISFLDLGERHETGGGEELVKFTGLQQWCRSKYSRRLNELSNIGFDLFGPNDVDDPYKMQENMV